MNTPSKEALEATKELWNSHEVPLHWEEFQNCVTGLIDRHFAPLRKRLAEMESLLESEKATRNSIIAKGQRAEARVKELKAEVEVSHSAALAAEEAAQKTEQANAELAGALRDAHQVAKAAPELNACNYDHDQVCELNTAMCEVFSVLDTALARHDAGEPAKHPDTDVVEWMERHANDWQEHLHGAEDGCWHKRYGTNAWLECSFRAAVRAAIDAARGEVQP